MKTATLKLELNKTYVDFNKKKVTMVREFAVTDPDYEQGFRFRGDNGVNYREDGGVEGHVGNAAIFQLGAVPLNFEFGTEGSSNLNLELGQFYRNHLGKVMLIVAAISADSRPYKNGYRFVDQQGSYYTAGGSMKSDLFSDLNLAEPVRLEDIDPVELSKIHRQADRLRKREGLMIKIREGWNKAVPYLIPAFVVALLVYIGRRLLRNRDGDLAAA